LETWERHQQLESVSPGINVFGTLHRYSRKRFFLTTFVFPFLLHRDPNTGASEELFGEFLVNAQGEDVVAGIRTPRNISELKQVMPEVYDEFVQNTQILEQKFGDMQDIEFTIQEGKLFMLQTRNGKRGGEAAVKIAVDLVNEGLITIWINCCTLDFQMWK
jgi:hypothetical protein